MIWGLELFWLTTMGRGTGLLQDLYGSPDDRWGAAGEGEEGRAVREPGPLGTGVEIRRIEVCV